MACPASVIFSFALSIASLLCGGRVEGEGERERKMGQTDT
jgi:hypothetical protein